MRACSYDALAADAVQPAPRRAAARDDDRRRDLGERDEHERALVHPRMRDRERGTSKTPPPEEKQIEIERARSVALAAALASVMALDRAEAREKRAW